MAEGYMVQLVGYIKKNLTKGYTIESLKWALINQGYARVEVQKAIDTVTHDLAHQAPILKEKPVIKVQHEPVLHEEVKSYNPSLWQRLKDFFK